MTLATWNVNSIRARLPRLLQWLATRAPDVVCLQETKVVDAEFPQTELQAAGYHAVFAGEKTYNGVAILSRTPAADPLTGLPGDGPDAPRRLLAATVEGIRIMSVYAPNGAEVGSDKYAFKLDWYRRLRVLLDGASGRAEPLAMLGDFNVAPDDRDVWDPEAWRDQVLCSEPERDAFRALVDWGLSDALRLVTPDATGIYTWWDYRGGAFHRGRGLRIDHALLTAPLAARCRAVTVDREARKGQGPSDHAPLVVELAPRAAEA